MARSAKTDKGRTVDPKAIRRRSASRRDEIAWVLHNRTADEGKGATTGNLDVPVAPVVGVARSLAQLNQARYELTVGVDIPGSPTNWAGIISTQVEITTDNTFATFPASKSLNRTFSNVPPMSVEFSTNYPGTYYIRARVENEFGFSAWTSTSFTTDQLDSLSDDTGLMDAPDPTLVTNSAGAHPELAGNEIEIDFDVTSPNSATYFGYTIILHDSSTLPVSTSVETGSAGSMTAGQTTLTDLTKSWTVNAWAGKNITIFSDKRGGSPTFDYEGAIICATILSNTANTVTFQGNAQNIHRTYNAVLKYQIVDISSANHFVQKVKFIQGPINDPAITTGMLIHNALRRVAKVGVAFAPVYVWISLVNVYGHGKVTASPPNATFAGLTSVEYKDGSLITAKINGTAAGNGAVTSVKTNIVNLGDITLNLGTVQTGLLQTAGSGTRITIDSTNGLRAFNGSTLTSQIDTTNARIKGFWVQGITDSLTFLTNDANGTLVIDQNSGHPNLTWYNLADIGVSAAFEVNHFGDVHLSNGSYYVDNNGQGVGRVNNYITFDDSGNLVSLYTNNSLGFKVDGSQIPYIGSVVAASVPANFAANKYIHFKDKAGTDYYVPAMAASW